MSYIEKFGIASRDDINKLIYPKLPSSMSKQRKNNRVRYIISLLRKEGKIINKGSKTNSSWTVNKN